MTVSLLITTALSARLQKSRHNRNILSGLLHQVPSFAYRPHLLFVPPRSPPPPSPPPPPPPRPLEGKCGHSNWPSFSRNWKEMTRKSLESNKQRVMVIADQRNFIGFKLAPNWKQLKQALVSNRRWSSTIHFHNNNSIWVEWVFDPALSYCQLLPTFSLHEVTGRLICIIHYLNSMVIF